MTDTNTRPGLVLARRTFLAGSAALGVLASSPLRAASRSAAVPNVIVVGANLLVPGHHGGHVVVDQPLAGPA